jgi:hypothetical protein
MLLQVIGLAILLACGGFWAATGRESIALMTAAGGLIMVGGYGDAKAQLKAAVRPPPPSDAPTLEVVPDSGSSSEGT